MSRILEFDKDEMLEKAMELFWEKGYNATSAQDIVSALGINRSSLYNTFGDKYQLFSAALKRYQDKSVAALQEMVANTKDPRGSLEDMFRALVCKSASDPLSKGCFMVNTAIELAPHDETMQAFVKANMEFSQKLFLSLLEKAAALGQVDASSDLVAKSRFLMNSLSGLRVAARTGLDPKAIEDVVEVTLSAL